MKKDDQPGTKGEPRAKLLRNVYTTSDVSASVDLEALSKELGLSKEQKSAFTKRLEDARHWLRADEGRLKRFQESPIEVLTERFSDIKQAIPKDLSDAMAHAKTGPCASVPPTGVYNACALELLARVAVWVAQGPGHRTAFETNPDTAVDAVAGTSPIEAVSIVKGALLAARRYP